MVPVALDILAINLVIESNPADISAGIDTYCLNQLPLATAVTLITYPALAVAALQPMVMKLNGSLEVLSYLAPNHKTLRLAVRLL